MERPAIAGKPLNGLGVDVEDWFQVGAFEDSIARSDWEGMTLRVERNVERICELFDRAGVKATFFTLGWIAERVPAAIRRIADRGHEIASHGYDHARVFTLSPEQFRADLAKSKAIIEAACGTKVTGYRAPSFSIDRRTPWAHEILAEEGYAYSSSVNPISHDHYGWREAPRFTFRPVAGSPLLEIPVTTVEVGGRRLGAGGGGFFRILPYGFSRWAVARVNTRENRPAVFYFHPWEIDPGQPRFAAAPLRSRLRHYTNLGAMEGKLEKLLKRFEWGRMDEIARLELARPVEEIV